LEENLEILGTPVNFFCGLRSKINAGQQIDYPNVVYLILLLAYCVTKLKKTIQHILVSCTFARQVWTLVLQKLELLAIASGI